MESPRSRIRVSRFSEDAGSTEEQAEASIPRMDVHVMEVSFDRITDPERRRQFQDLPTSFVLPEEDVDNLRDVAGELMRQSPEYKAMLRTYGGSGRD